MSTETRGNAYVLEVMKREFRNLGYVGGLLQENYEFVDILASEHIIGAIPLATFSQEPTSYRNASFGVALANGKSGRALVESYRSLGAPQIFEIAKDRIVRWKVACRRSPCTPRRSHSRVVAQPVFPLPIRLDT